MILIRIIRYLRGYVRFEARGGFIERFLNLMARGRIPVWDGRKRGDVYHANVTASGYRKLRGFAKKTNVRLRILEKHGFPFLRFQHRRRTGLLAGLAVFLAFLAGMSRFVWRIQVTGNEELSETAVLAALEELGIAPGVSRSSIDIRDCERRALLLLPDLSWIALNVDGSYLEVRVDERALPPEMVDPTAPCNIVAREAGQILSLYAYDGQPMVQVGDTVLPGDIIVSGITQDMKGKNRFRHARADVVAQVQTELTVTVPLDQMEYVETGKTMRRRYLQAFGGEIPLFLPLIIPSPYRVERKESALSVFSQPLPVSILREDYILMEERRFRFTEEEAKREAMRELGFLQQARLGEGEILSRQVSGTLLEDAFELRGSYVCNMEIGLQKEILVAED